MTEEHVGKVVDGRYRLDHVLGEGAMGAVYAATQLSVDRTVAVKLLHQSDDGAFADRFQREARAIGKLSHTNIITLHDFGWDDELGAHFMVTEYAEGVPLSERMKEVMSTDLILKIALEVASAMHHAHAQGITHRDLKPENVILARADGRVDVAKVLDFGLAHLYDRGAEPDYAYGDPDNEENGYEDSDEDEVIYGDSLAEIDGETDDEDVATMVRPARETARYEPGQSQQPEPVGDEEPATTIIPRAEFEAYERDAAAAYDEANKDRETEDE